MQELSKKALKLHDAKVAEWLNSNPTWDSALQPPEKALYVQLPPDRQARAAYWLSQGRCLEERLQHLYRLEREAKSDARDAEQDTIAALMVLLQDEITASYRNWSNVLSR